MTDHINDNTLKTAAVPEPDAHGQAAFLLVESLIHGLIARGVVTNGTAIEIVETAREVKVEVASELGDSPATLRRSLVLLQNLSASLESDQPK